MEVKWLVEDYEADGSLASLIEEIKSQGMECDVIDYVPFQAGEYDNYSDESCVVFFGSLNLASQLQRQKPWIPGPICNFKNLSCLAYYSHWGHYLFNHDYIMLPILEVSRRRKEIYKKFGIDECIFMRPNSGAKAFCGNVYPLEELDWELKQVSSCAGKEMDDIMAIVSSPKVIDREWRLVVEAGNGPISASQYKKNGKLDEEEGCPRGAFDVAYEIAKEEWQPDKIYTVDVCESGGEFSFLEVNSFSCSGIYKCPPRNIVKTVSEIAAREWKEYQV